MDITNRSDLKLFGMELTRDCPKTRATEQNLAQIQRLGFVTTTPSIAIDKVVRICGNYPLGNRPLAFPRNASIGAPC